MKRVIIAKAVYEVLKDGQNFLFRSDISTVPADTNALALALHKEQPADLIIAELDDGDLPGEKLCSLIRKDSGLRNVSLMLVCSGAGTDLKRCVQCSANAFVSRPLNTVILLQEAYQLLNIAARKAYRLELRVRCEGTTKGRPFTGHTENISTTGLLLESRADLLEGDLIVCSFSLPETRRLTVTAEVVRVITGKLGQAKIYGACFADISPEVISAIEALTGEDSRRAGRTSRNG